MCKKNMKLAYESPVCNIETLVLEAGVMAASDVTVSQINPASTSIESMQFDNDQLTF